MEGQPSQVDGMDSKIQTPLLRGQHLTWRNFVVSKCVLASARVGAEREKKKCPNWVPMSKQIEKKNPPQKLPKIKVTVPIV